VGWVGDLRFSGLPKEGGSATCLLILTQTADSAFQVRQPFRFYREGTRGSSRSSGARAARVLMISDRRNQYHVILAGQSPA